MKLQPDQSDVQSISGYGPGWIAVDGERIESSVVLSSTGLRFDWQCHTFEDLGPAHFSRLAEIDAELVIFGSGERIRFPTPAWLAPLIAKRVGVETMDTRAACRTYNILSGEGRKVIAALLVEIALPQVGSAADFRLKS
jgi:uncharacterized protein